MAWCDVIWYGILWNGMVWHGMAWNGILYVMVWLDGWMSGCIRLPPTSSALHELSVCLFFCFFFFHPPFSSPHPPCVVYRYISPLLLLAYVAVYLAAVIGILDRWCRHFGVLELTFWTGGVDILE